MNTNHFLAITDLSAPARHATERAAMLSKALSSPLDVLHIADLQPLTRLRVLLSDSPPDMEQKILDTAQHKLNELAATLHQRHGIAVKTEVIAGNLLPEVQKACKGYHASLLICGAKGESFLRHIALGSTAARLLNHAPCPVLVVKQPARRSYQRILVPVDFSSASLPVIQLAQAMAPGADIVLMHAFHIPLEGKMRYAQLDQETIQRYQVIAKQDAFEKLQSLRDRAGLPADKTWLVVVEGDAATLITEQEQECDCDLIVMGKQGEGALEEMLLGSVSKRVLAESHSDVLISIATK
jgi:nucleotide-binding universal stress UspA family protein